jgi:hypothetical protein
VVLGVVLFPTIFLPVLLLLLVEARAARAATPGAAAAARTVFIVDSLYSLFLSSLAIACAARGDEALPSFHFFSVLFALSVLPPDWLEGKRT